MILTRASARRPPSPRRCTCGDSFFLGLCHSCGAKQRPLTKAQFDELECIQAGVSHERRPPARHKVRRSLEALGLIEWWVDPLVTSTSNHSCLAAHGRRKGPRGNAMIRMVPAIMLVALALLVALIFVVGGACNAIAP